MQYLGRVTVRVNGEVQDSNKGATLDLGGIQRTPVSTDQAMGYTEENKPSRVECELPLKRGATFEALRTFKDGSLTYECDTGQRYLIKGAYTLDTLQLSNGAFKVVFQGEPAQELVS